MYEQILQTLGLPIKEGLAYEALLKLGETSIKPLLRETSLKRGNLYDVLYSLEKKGLCELIEVGKKTRFRPASPEKLLDLAKIQKERVEAAEQSLGEVIPALTRQFQTQAARPYVGYFVGIEGLKKVYEHILKKKQPLKIFSSNLDRKNPDVAKLITKQIPKQHAAGITVQALGDSGDPTLSPKELASLTAHGIAIQKLDNFSLPSQILIFGKSVAITALEPYLLTTYIESQEIADTLTAIFTRLWPNTPPEQAKLAHTPAPGIGTFPPSSENTEHTS